MKFSKVLGKCDPELVRRAEACLSAAFIELSMSRTNNSLGTGLGGDVLLYQLVAPLQQICDARSIEFDQGVRDIEAQCKQEQISSNEAEVLKQVLEARVGSKLLRTAATNGKEFIWSPTFITSLSKIGLRLVIAHEGWHSIYMHASRRAGRIPMLWNIAVDYKVNYSIIADLRTRKVNDAAGLFKKEVGEFVTLEEYASFLRDPFNPPEKLADRNPTKTLQEMANPGYVKPTEAARSLYFADTYLSDEHKKPENIYSYLLSQIPRCSHCGRMGVWKKPEEYKKLEQQLKDNDKQ